MVAGTQVRAQGDCLNTIQFLTVTPPSDGSLSQFTTCVFFEEYTEITGVVAGANYEVGVNNGGYITVREGTFDGPVIGQGSGLVTVSPTISGAMYAHFTVNDMCTTATGSCNTATVQWLLDCVFPEATLDFDVDCALFEYYVNIDVLSTGDGNTVDVTYESEFGFIETVPGVGTGVITLGPFIIGDIVDVFIAHESDPICTLSFLSQQPILDCPISINCGGSASNFSHCYGNNEISYWTYESNGPGTLLLEFISGTIESSNFDVLTIYDGIDATGPVLFVHNTFTTLDLSGLTVSTTSGFLHMELTTDGVVNCIDGDLSQWNWTVTCLNCLLPVVSAIVVDDCLNNQFNIDLDVVSTGDGSTVEAVFSVNGGPNQSQSGLGVGVTSIGPFLVNDQVALAVIHDSDPACTVSLGTLTDTGTCPNLITCGQPALVETYCYEPSDSQDWSYQAIGSGTLRLRFNIGTIESNTFDDLAIYDGPDNTAPILFQHTNTLTYNLGPAGSAVNNTFTNYYGVEVYATGTDLYMEMSSDGSVQCGGTFPTTTYDAWEWEVVCLDCTIPLASATVVDDCAGNGFSVPVDITSTGDGGSVNIVYTVNGGDPEVLTGVGVGITDLGPFVINDVVNIVIEHESNELCNISLGNFTDTGTCPTLVDCGTEYTEVFCHGNSIDERFYYQGTGTFPLALLVNTGTIETCCDRFYVYDGGDITAPELTPPGGAVGNLAGLFFTSTNVDHKLTVRVTTDGSVSCQSGSNVQLDFTLSCLDCNPPVASFEIVQDCDNFQYYVDIDVTSLGSDPEIEITNTGGLPDSTITEPGVYQMGPIVSGTPIEFTLVNSDNSLCNLSSVELVNPLCPMIVCGATFIEETYCYGPNEDNAWAYEKPGTTGELHLTFNRGTIESITWDNLKIYDGPDANGPILFEHNNAATWNLGPAGSAINNTIANYYEVDVVSTTGNLYMTLTSDGSVQCTSSTTYDEWEWDVYCVGCAAPGISYNLVPNCFDRTFKAEVIVTEPPPAEGLQMENTFTGDMQVATEVGVYEFGPYDQNDPVEFELIILDNPLCSYFSDTLTYASSDCVSLTCGFDNYTYCYQNNEDRWYTFQADAPVPITIGFLGGQMLPGDRIVLYNGFDETAAVLYQGNNGGNFTGFALNSQNVDNALTLRIQSNGDVACSDPGSNLAPLNWYVACGAVGIEEQGEGAFTIYPNPTEGLMYIDLGNMEGRVQMRVLDMSGRLVIEELINANGAPNTVDMQGLMSGQYMVQLTTSDWVRTRLVQVSR